MQIFPNPQLDDETNQIRRMTAQAREIVPNEHFVRRGAEPASHGTRSQALVRQADPWAPYLLEEYGGIGRVRGARRLPPRRVVGLWRLSVHVARSVFAIGSGMGRDRERCRAVQV